MEKTKTVQPGITRRRYMKGMSATAAYLALTRSAYANSSSDEMPNVLVIQPDQHRGTIMGCAGDDQVITPNLDRLANEGMRFTNCTSSCPLCSPCRGTFQTGLFPYTHGVKANNTKLNTNLTTFAEVFAENGYDTGYIGKWHLNGNKEFEDLPGGYIQPGADRQGWQEWLGYEIGHEYFDVWQFDENQQEVRVEGYDWEPTWHTDMALDFIGRKTNENKPWLYYISYGPPHNPSQCPQEFLDMYDPNAFVLPPDVTDDNSTRDKWQMYYAQITSIDYEIGRIVSGLKALGVEKNTIIIYISDHGEKLGNHGSFGKKDPYATSFRIPFLVRWPEKVKPNQVSDCMVNSVDVAPTILDLAGLSIPSAMEGDSMADWCVHGAGKNNEAVYLAFSKKWYATWDGRYLYSVGDHNFLYDHQTDPHEMTDLLNSPAHQGQRSRLHGLLLGLATEVGDQGAIDKINEYV